MITSAIKQLVEGRDLSGEEAHVAMMQVMSGPHPLDHTTCEAWPQDFLGRLGEGVKGKKFAYSPDLGHARVDPDRRRATGALLSAQDILP